MNFNKFLIIPVLALFPAITACGDDCKSACEDLNECAGATIKADCDATCDEKEKLAEDADCSDQYDDAASCYAGVDDICKIDGNTCNTEEDAYTKCVLPYCMKNTTAAGCEAYTDDGT